ncbi:MAG: T9SS type A sorting domain-containing protein [Ignavibacteriae bacterium]|nr:T9SS type A sorting domain-containing protein [Ignavibacteriota bacterium]
MDYDMKISDSVISFYNEPYPAILDTIIIENVFSRNLNTYYFSFTQYDFYSYSDSIGFNTLWATSWNNWVPEYLLGCEIDGKKYGQTISSIENDKEIKTDFILYQNYPNPFNPSTKINFSIPTKSIITLKIFDILGNEIETLINQEKALGNYVIDFNAKHLSSGIYFYKLQVENFSQSKKFVLLK